MKIAQKISDLTGKTPLLRLGTLSDKYGSNIIVKLECYNPMSNIKDRVAVAMIDAAEKSGQLKPGGLIIEPTSGNTGIGLALMAASRGYRLILTMPDTMSIERRKLLKVLGAELVLTPGADGMVGAIAMAETIQRENPGSFLPQQFKNLANPEIHRLTTAPEIWQDTDGLIDIFVAGVGTGGTITGCGSYLKERNPDIKIIAVEPQESAVLSGGQPGPNRIQGIGAGFIPEILDVGIIDEIVQVSALEAAEMARLLARTEGVLTGISSGAAVVAATKIGSRVENKDKNIVVILPDSGERYLSTWIFDEDS
ncbi:MAG: cysteine synthase A [Fibrobacter sp.]|nr:cysteine synthase A [Fibrobacter sp.]